MALHFLNIFQLKCHDIGKKARPRAKNFRIGCMSLPKRYSVEFNNRWTLMAINICITIRQLRSYYLYLIIQIWFVCWELTYFIQIKTKTLILDTLVMTLISLSQSLSSSEFILSVSVLYTLLFSFHMHSMNPNHIQIIWMYCDIIQWFLRHIIGFVASFMSSLRFNDFAPSIWIEMNSAL